MALSNERIWEIADAHTQHNRTIHLIFFARAIEAEARAQDEALIRQLVEALDGSIAITMDKIDLRNAALTAARARLEVSIQKERSDTADLWREVRKYLVAAADGSMSRNNSEQLASELLEQLSLLQGKP